MADNKEKYEDLLNMLSLYTVVVCVNVNVEGVVLPPHVIQNATENGQGVSKLKLSTRFDNDMTIKKDRVITDLSFKGVRFTCEIPYSSIFGLCPVKSYETDEEPLDLLEYATFYEEDMPQEYRDLIDLTLGSETDGNDNNPQ